MKAQFSFCSVIASKTSVVLLPVLNKDVRLCTLPTALTLSPAGSSCRRAREKLCSHLVKHLSVGQTHQLSWRSSIGGEILPWQETLFHARALSGVALLGRAFGFDQLVFFFVFAQNLTNWLVPRFMRCLAEVRHLVCGHRHWSGWLLLETLSLQSLVNTNSLSNPG